MGKIGRFLKFPLDFYLWGFCKEKFHKKKPANVADLKTEVEILLTEISVEIRAIVIENFQKKVERCIQRHGNYFEHKIK